MFKTLTTCGLSKELRKSLLYGWSLRLPKEGDMVSQEQYELMWWYVLFYESVESIIKETETGIIRDYKNIRKHLDYYIRSKKCPLHNLATHGEGQ